MQRRTASYAPTAAAGFSLETDQPTCPLNYFRWSNIEALKVILKTYDLPRHYDAAARSSQRLLNGLQSIGHGMR